MRVITWNLSWRPTGTACPRRRPEILALEAVADHPQGPLRLLTTCIDWEREDAARPP